MLGVGTLGPWLSKVHTSRVQVFRSTDLWAGKSWSVVGIR